MQKTRNYGIDMLRIISMFMVVILHLLGYGGILGNAIQLSSNYWVAWFLEISAYCAVNCFALISGYVMHNSSAKLSKLLELWLQIIFYTILITLVLFIFFPDVRGIKTLIDAVFPVSRAQYWYLSSYFGMYLILPILNIAINSLDKKTLTKVFVCIFMAMSILQVVLKGDPYKLENGYSVAWISILYLLGGYIDEYDVAKKLSAAKSMILFWVAIVVTFSSKFILEYASKFFLGKVRFGEILVSYISPTIIMAAIFLFIFCINVTINIKMTKIIKIFAPASLGVYIIHVNPLLRAKFLKNITLPFLNSNCLIMALEVLVSGIALYISCSLVDIVRIHIFKYLKVKSKCQNVENIISNIADKYI